MQEALIRLEEIRSALPEDVLYTPIDTREESTTQKRILSNKKASVSYIHVAGDIMLKFSCTSVEKVGVLSCEKPKA
jgi:hypothetical protein